MTATMRLCNSFHSSIKYDVSIARPFSYPDGYPVSPKTIGEHIRKKRMDCRLMQSDVAHIIGVSEGSIWSWENGMTEPSKKNLKIINNFISAYSS